MNRRSGKLGALQEMKAKHKRTVPSMKGGLSGTSAAPEITPNIVVAIPALEFTPHAVNFFDGLGGVIDAFRTAFSVFEE